MSIVEAQTPLPTPPTGMDTTITVHPFNPENGFYEPTAKTPPLNANIAITNAAQNLIVGIVAATPVWIYHMVFANNTAGVITYTLTEPGGNTYIVVVPANTTVVILSTLDAPLFRSTAAGNLTVVGDAVLSGNITIAYVVK